MGAFSVLSITVSSTTQPAILQYFCSVQTCKCSYLQLLLLQQFDRLTKSIAALAIASDNMFDRPGLCDLALMCSVQSQPRAR